MPAAERRTKATRTLFSRMPKRAHDAMASRAERGPPWVPRSSFKMRSLGFGGTCYAYGYDLTAFVMLHGLLMSASLRNLRGSHRGPTPRQGLGAARRSTSKHVWG